MAHMTNDIEALIVRAGETNEANKFNRYSKAYDDGYGLEYLAMKDLLEVSESCEALDETRHGHAPDEVYFSGDQKLEGYIIEKLDAMIRNFGTLYEVAQKHDIPISKIVEYLNAKMDYNARRKDTAASGDKLF